MNLIEFKHPRLCAICEEGWNSFPLYESTEILICSNECREMYELNPLGYESKRKYIEPNEYRIRGYSQYEGLKKMTVNSMATEGGVIITREPIRIKEREYGGPVIYKDYKAVYTHKKNSGMVLS